MSDSSTPDTEEYGDQNNFAEEVKAGKTGELNRDSTNVKKFLTFTLQDEVYGLGILKVREIIGYMDVTPVPQTPVFVKGVVNLRGQVIPVINLRQKFGMNETEVTDETCIIVVEVEVGRNGEEKQQVQMGILVDTVEEVLDIQEDDIEPAPSFGGDIDTEYIKGMGKIDEKVVILLDIDRVLTDDQLVALEELGTE